MFDKIRRAFGKKIILEGRVKMPRKEKDSRTYNVDLHKGFDNQKHTITIISRYLPQSIKSMEETIGADKGKYLCKVKITIAKS